MDVALKENMTMVEGHYAETETAMEEEVSFEEEY